MYYLNKFIFGESETEKKDSSGEQLETQLLDDWVVVHPSGEGFRDIVQEDPVLKPEPDGAAVSVVETRLVNSMLSPGLATPEQMTLRLRSAQRIQNCKSKRSITNRRCEQQNKVYEVQGQSKANNRRNKRLRPSGFKSSRITQRM